MGGYLLKSHIFTINMGGCDVIMNTKWFYTSGYVTMDYTGLVHELVCIVSNACCIHEMCCL